MTNPRKYGKAPFRIAAIHGGPGAAGEMAPVGRELSSDMGVLEPLQTATTLRGQVDELTSVLEDNADLPVILIGYSWGAWLSLIVASQSPNLVGKLILVGCGPLEEKWADRIMETRMSRLSDDDKTTIKSLMKIIADPADPNRDYAFTEFAAILSKADTYEALPDDSDKTDTSECRVDIFQAVWDEAAALRRSGKLLEIAQKVSCPVVAIHGDYDPHPADGVRQSLSAILPDFRFILLEKCGHKPWIERQARDRFFRLIRDSIGIKNNC